MQQNEKQYKKISTSAVKPSQKEICQKIESFFFNKNIFSNSKHFFKLTPDHKIYCPVYQQEVFQTHFKLIFIFDSYLEEFDGFKDIIDIENYLISGQLYRDILFKGTFDDKIIVRYKTSQIACLNALENNHKFIFSEFIDLCKQYGASFASKTELKSYINDTIEEIDCLLANN